MIFATNYFDMKIRLISIFALVIMVVFIACLKDDYQTFTCNASAPKVVVPGSELLEIESYLSKNNITDAIKSDKGFYYKIVTAGTGATPTVCSNVTIYYKGSLLNGTVFDQTGTAAATFPLAQLIAGWQLALPLIKTGGKIILYLPPSLGYGNQSAGQIPAGSSLIFEITLLAA
jgi:FKBP-type peptidyl-prolyl cis-trans isomerase FkpA